MIINFLLLLWKNKRKRLFLLQNMNFLLK